MFDFITRDNPPSRRNMVAVDERDARTWAVYLDGGLWGRWGKYASTREEVLSAMAEAFPGRKVCVL